MCAIKNNISICGIVGVPGNYGGFETFAENLILNTSGLAKYTVYCDKNFTYDKTKILLPDNVRLIKLPLRANGWQSIFYDALSMALALRNRDVILLLGCSGGWFIPIVKIMGGKVITNIAGLEWARSKWGNLASSFLKWSEKVAIKYSDIVVADNQELCNYVRKSYGVDSKVIAYGADHVKTSCFDFDGIKQKYSVKFQDYFISVGRCQPDNHIREIVESFVGGGENLVAISNWRSCQYGNDILDKYSGCDNILLLDPIYDIYDISSLRLNARAYIHGHSAGGTNPTLAEAMYLGVPIFSYDVSFNRYTTAENAIFWQDVDSLKDCLVMADNEELLLKNSKKAKLFANKYYTWKFISSEYIKLFNKA